MKNDGMFSTLFIEDLKDDVRLDDAAQGRMATLAQTWSTRNTQDADSLWESFLKQALSYLEFVPPTNPDAPNVYPLYEDWGFSNCITVLYLAPPGSDIEDTAVGRFYPAKLIAQLRKRKLNWGILTDGARWRLYSTKSSCPYEDFVELPLADALENNDEAEYGLFEAFFHKECFLNEELGITNYESNNKDSSFVIRNCKLDFFREESERILTEKVQTPLLAQVDEVLQYICNGFIFDTKKSGDEYTDLPAPQRGGASRQAGEERAEIFESAVKLIYRCLFLFYAEARRLLPTDPEKADLYRRYSIRTLCLEARKFRWGERRDTDQYDLWKHLKGLVNAVNDGDPEYGIMGYNGGLFDDEEERFLGQHQLRNDFLSRALYLLAFVEPYDNEPDEEYPIPYEDLEVRHLGELYENILEYTVQLADADRIRRRTKKGVELLLASQTTRKAGDTLIKKGEVYFGESALERKQTGSYYTPESLVRFLNEKTIIQPLRETFERDYRGRFDEFLDQARKGHDAGARRGAAQSAAALVERFAIDAVLNFKVCDPAMGSGHFLVDAANQMAELIVSLFAELPQTENAELRMQNAENNSSFIILNSDLNYWRRRITRHCLYGIDLNPLAVDLAKLSLWLNCFASDHRLTFLDHHLRCGNSLIGIRSLTQLASIPERKKESKKKKDPQMLLFDFNDLSSALAEAAKGVASITRIDEDDTDTQKAVLDEALEATSDLRPLADLFTAYLMDPNIAAGDYKELFENLATGKPGGNSLNPALPEILASVEAYRDRHHFYHWPLEFPDVFGPDAVGGFSATVGNPPWDVLQPNTQEFYVAYDLNFRKYKKQEALKVIEQLHKQHPIIVERWQEYEAGFKQASAYCKEPEAYTSLQKGKIDLYKAFLERFFAILKNGGRMGIVVPSGIYTDQGCQPLREMFFNRSRIEFLYCFENRRAVFNIHRSFKFVLFGTQKGGKTDRFKCAFMEHDPERLPVIDANALKMSVKQVRKFSPGTLSLIEFKSKKDLELTTKIYSDLPTLGETIEDTWNLELSQEFNRSSDSHLFNTDGNGCPLYEGKNTSSYDHQFTALTYWIAEDIVREDEYRSRWRILKKRNIVPQSFDFEQYRAVFRRIAASTNERSFLATVIPRKSVCPDTNLVVRRLRQNPDDGKPIENIGTAESGYLVAVLNSFVIDYVIRQKITTHLDMHFVYSVPVPRLGDRSDSNELFGAIVARVARLISVSDEYGDFWRELYARPWQYPEFWYPSCAPIDNYGPAHEQEIRRRLRDEAKNLTPEWGPHCGVHDRLADRRDTGDRAQLRAEIDAYVAHLYGLSRDDFAYILDTFPVLKKKEMKAFGEFMSKRKCLEEYDRIEKIMNAEG